MEATVNMKMAPQELALLVRALSARKDDLDADIRADNWDPKWRREARAEIVQISALLGKLI